MDKTSLSTVMPPIVFVTVGLTLYGLPLPPLRFGLILFFCLYIFCFNLANSILLGDLLDELFDDSSLRMAAISCRISGSRATGTIGSRPRLLLLLLLLLLLPPPPLFVGVLMVVDVSISAVWLEP